MQSVLKLGPLNKVMGMIPGIPPWMSQSIGGGDGGDRIKGFPFNFFDNETS
jgi:signal recognition particle GTPase